jgi:transcriptional regulator with XRE-family HTH domain
MKRDDERLIFGTNLRAARLAQGLTQERLAELAGVDRTYISQAERGLCNPSLSTLGSLARVLGVAKRDLIGDD